MNFLDQRTIVKRIAKLWKRDKDEYDNSDGVRKDLYGMSMLTNQIALEMCGLTLNEIISLGNADDISIAVDELFSKSQK